MEEMENLAPAREVQYNTISLAFEFHFLYPFPSSLSRCKKAEYLFPPPQRSSL